MMLNFGQNQVVAKVCLVFFFFFFCGSGRSLCDRPRASFCGRCPVIWHDLFSRTLPTITCRNLV